MQKDINVEKEYVIGDSTMVKLLSKKRGLNKGKGYSMSLVDMVKRGERNNEEVTKLFIEVINHRNELLK